MNTSRKHVSESGSHAALDIESRINKAEKIKNVLIEMGVNPENKKVLDIGTGSGDIAHYFSKFAKTVDSVDLFDERTQKKGYIFHSVKTAELPFKDKEFDIVISNHVVEHIPDQETHLKEALRVLVTNGSLYLATPNKYWITDPHYKLFFISWLPRKVSDKYLKTIKGKECSWDIYPASNKLIKKNAKGNNIAKAIPMIIKMDIPKEQMGKLHIFKQILKIFPNTTLKPLQHVSPTLVYVITKK